MIVEFQHEPERVYMNDAAGRCIAEVTFPISGGTATIDHTFVDPALRGQGVAERLLATAVKQIRSQGLKARPTCPYAVKWFAGHPEHAGLLHS
jgi:predicted GNAT family acetyltransferase